MCMDGASPWNVPVVCRAMMQPRNRENAKKNSKENSPFRSGLPFPRKGEQRRHAMDAVHELSVGQHEKEREDEREVADEERRHRSAFPQHQEQQPRGAGQKEHDDEGNLETALGRIAERWVAGSAQREESRRSDE